MSRILALLRDFDLTPLKDQGVSWPKDLARGLSGDNRRLGGSETVIYNDPLFAKMGLQIPLEEWQQGAPLTWYHGSPHAGLTYLDPNQPKAHTPFIQVWGVYLSRYVETARVFGRNIYRVTIPDRDLLVPDPDIQGLTKGDYLAVVYQGELFDVVAVSDPKELIVPA